MSAGVADLPTHSLHPCSYLEQEKALFKNRGQMRVLELGAGLGLAGIVAALQVRGLFVCRVCARP